MLRTLRWSIIPCPVCRTQVAIKLRRCPHCQTDFSNAAIQKRQQRSFTKKIVVAGGFIALIALVLLSTAFSDRRPALPQTSANWPSPGSASQRVTAAYKAFRAQLQDSRQGCESASKAFDLSVQAMRSGNANHFDGRRMALYTERACKTAATSITALNVPEELPGTATVVAQEAIDTCRQAMETRHKAARTAFIVMEGDLQPTTIEAVAQINLSAQDGLLACSAGLNSVAGAAGVDLGRLRNL